MKQIYEDGSYLKNNPTWHEEESPWKAKQITKIIEANGLKPNTICEIGCGAGEILNQLSMQEKNKGKEFFGYEISPQAFELCKKKSKPNLTFQFKDLLDEQNVYFDMIMAIDVIEHVEDCYRFLRKLKERGEYKIFHIPLELSVQTILRSSPLILSRKRAGHIHYFTKETALETLCDTKYDIIDYFYTFAEMDFMRQRWPTILMKSLRKIAISVHQDLAVRILGGFSLLVLAK